MASDTKSSFSRAAIGILWDGNKHQRCNKPHEVGAVPDLRKPDAEDVRIESMLHALARNMKLDDHLGIAGVPTLDEQAYSFCSSPLTDEQKEAIGSAIAMHFASEIDEFIAFVSHTDEAECITVRIRRAGTYRTTMSFRGNIAEISIGGAILPSDIFRTPIPSVPQADVEKEVERLAKYLTRTLLNEYRERGFFIQDISRSEENASPAENEMRYADDDLVGSFRISWFEPGVKAAKRSVTCHRQVEAYAMGVPIEDIFHRN